jgi:hypothetical protein
MQVVVGAARRAASGQTVCGDSYTVVRRDRGVLVCVADGLGHGPAAMDASEAACRHARENERAPLDALMLGIDAALRGSRGAAVSLLAIDADARRIRFAGVGNVELRALARAPIAPPNVPGIVGQRVRNVRVWEYALADGDVLALASDGISHRFDLGALVRLDPQSMAETIVADHHRAHDDACCVVARAATGA